MEQNKVIYREVQKPRSFLAWAFVILFSIFMWYQFFQQIIFGIPVGDNPAPDGVLIMIWLIFGVAFPIILLFFTKLIIEVREDGLYIRYMPFHLSYKQFLFRDITHYESISYHPFGRFGGWGIRFNFSGEMAYNMDGNKALELHIKGQTLVIGTRNPEGLKTAIDSLIMKQ